MRNDPVMKVLWWLCLFVAPIVLITIELYHPGGFTQSPGMYAYLSKPEPYNPQYHALHYFGPAWWFTLHMIQTPSMGLVAVGLWLLVSGVTPQSGSVAWISAWLSRVATFVFFVYYTSLDAIGGVGLGKTIELTEGFVHSGQLTPDQLNGVILVLNATWTNSWVGGVGSFISETGSWAVFLSAFFGGIALFFTRAAPWPALLLLVGFGWQLQVSHTAFHGPIAFALLIVSAAWIWWARGR